MKNINAAFSVIIFCMMMFAGNVQAQDALTLYNDCLLYTSPSPRD